MSLQFQMFRVLITSGFLLSQLTEAEHQRLDDLRMDTRDMEPPRPTDPPAAAGEGGQGQCWDAETALPSMMAMSPPPYLPTYRDRFFTADGLTCGSTGTMVRASPPLPLPPGVRCPLLPGACPMPFLSAVHLHPSDMIRYANLL